MIIETEGLIIKQNAILNNKRMLVVFTKSFGKISASTSGMINTKTKSSLAYKPFTYSKYMLYKGRNYFSINSAETIKSFFKIAENIEKYEMACSALELLDKVIFENQQCVEIFNLFIEFLNEVEQREKEFLTLFLAFEIKLLKYLGQMPQIRTCIKCNTIDDLKFISIIDGGVLCVNCSKNLANQRLIYEINSVIIKMIDFILKNPLSALEKVKIDKDIINLLDDMLKSYFSYHLDVFKLNSEKMEEKGWKFH